MSKKKIALVVLLMIVGLLLIFSNQISNYYIKYMSDKAATEVKTEITAEKIETNKNAPITDADMFDFSKVKPLSAEDNIIERPSFDSKNVIGIVNIPSRNIFMPIYRGVLNVNLKTGAGTLKNSQVMGERNYPIAGHHNRNYGVLFNRVPEMKNGENIYITDKKTVYTYKVYDYKKVPETATKWIEDSVATEHGKPVITLITCFQRGETGERILVFGELVSKEDYNEKKFNSLIE